MRKSIALCTMLLLMSCSATAQRGNRTPQKPPTPPTIEERVKKLEKKLNLSAEQKVEVLEIYYDSKYEEYLKKLKEKDLDRDDMRKLMKAIRGQVDSINNSIKKILTKKQIKKFDKLIREEEESHNSKMQERGRRGRGGRGGRGGHGG